MSLDLFGLKAQVLGRFEDLEARESKQEELLSELVSAMERRGHGTVKVPRDG
jgi:hypothetical protein